MDAPLFSWLSFFFGGAVGSLIGSLLILGLEKIYESISARRQYNKEREQVTLAFHEETKVNILMCQALIDWVDDNATAHIPYLFAYKFDYTWLELYSNRFLDFSIAK